MNANEIYNDVLENIFELKNNGESNVVFGEKITDTFNVSFTSENEVSVEYLGKTNKVQLPKSIDTIPDELLSKYIMKGFGELYLNKIPNNNMNESILSKIISESIKKVLNENKECPNCGAPLVGDRCEHCGTNVKLGNCKNCGAPLNHNGHCEHCDGLINESKEQNEVVLQSVDTKPVKTTKTGCSIYKVWGETTDGEQFEGYTSPNSSCSYSCRGLCSEYLIRKQQLIKITYHVTPKGRNSIDFMDFIDKY